MNPIRLYFNIFNANQLFSPILGEYRTSKKRLQNFFSEILPQLKRRGRIDSRKLPINVHIKFYTSKDNFQPQCLLLLSYKIIEALKASTILQDTNNLCIKSISFDTIKRWSDEGCDIIFTKD